MGSFNMILCLLIMLMMGTTWSAKLGNHRNHREQQSYESLEGFAESNDGMNEETRSKSKVDGSDDIGDIISWKRPGRSGSPVSLHPERSRRTSRSTENDDSIPFSNKRFRKMLEKAILKIITGDLTDADITLLKSLNYSLEEVLAIRERELAKNLDYDKLKTKQSSFTESPKTDEKYQEIGITESTVTSSTSRTSKKNEDNIDRDFDFDAYNKQAVYDYENGGNKMSEQSELERVSSIDYEDPVREIKEVVQVEDNQHANFDRAMESHVVFKIRYDDSEFDSTSDEKTRQLSIEQNGKLDNQNISNENGSKDKTDDVMTSKAPSLSSNKFNVGQIDTTSGNHDNKTFQSSNYVDRHSSLPVVHKLNNFVTSNEETTSNERETFKEPGKDFGINEDVPKTGKSKLDEMASSTLTHPDDIQVDLLVKNKTSDDSGKSSMYEGLEWVEDDVYRVIPQAIDELNYENVGNDVENDTVEESYGNANRTSDAMFYDDKNDTVIYQNESPDDDNQNANSTKPIDSNLSAYQQLAMAHRRDQGQKAIEDIKLKVLALTGRFNLSSTSNQVQRERLTMFSPICQTPRNTDLETWSDPFFMNMYFQLNLTSGDHVVAAKMRMYKLPQTNINVSSSAPTLTVEEEDDEEKKIRISIYFYTKSLKKHRSKKRLMDSVVTSLTSQGSHLALDVRQALRYWRQNTRSSSHVNNSNNHGLVIQVEDQDGKPLKPSNYIQQDSCHTSEQSQDDKAYQRVPALFVQACSRYVRVVNGETVTYVNCSKSLRSERH